VAYLYRVACLLVAVLFCGSALAVQEYRDRNNYGPWTTSLSDACANDVAWANSLNNAFSYTFVSVTPPTTCTMHPTVRATGASQSNDVVQEQTRNVTPAGDQFCKDQSVLRTATFGLPVRFEGPGQISSGTDVCIPYGGSPAGKGCKVTFNRDLSFQDSSGAWHSKGTITEQGNGSAECSLTTPGPVPDSCPNGQPGTVNGLTVCVPFPPDTPVQTTDAKSTTSTNVVGTTTTVITNNETKITTCTGDGACTTITTITSSDGTTKTTTSTQTKDALCASDPSNKACKTGDTPGKGAVTGSCAGGYSVTGGDPLLGQAALKLAEIKCKFFDTVSAESALYDASKAATSTGIGTETIAISPSSFDQTNSLGGAVGMADKVVTIGGTGWSRTVTLEFSRVNPALAYLGNVLVAVSLLIAMMIVFRRTA
jgi:hypothetical protein